ncbi:hypothetical protein Tco_1193017 [Tanacetum coccineum]
MNDGDERKHVLDYTHVDLHYVDDQRKNLLNIFNLLKQELSLHKSKLCNLKNAVSINCSLQNEVIRVNLENESLKDEISDLKKVIEKWTCSKVTLDQLLFEQVPHNIVNALGGKGRRKENNFSKEVVFTKADEYSSEPALEITSDSETDCDTQEPLPALPMLIGAEPSGTSNNLISLSDLTSNMAKLTLNNSSKRSKKSSVKMSHTYVIKKTEPKDYLKRSVWYLDSRCSKHMTWVKQYLHRYSKEPGPKVVFGDDSSGDTKGYGSVNCNGITFTRVIYVNGLKHNLISICQLCDANFKVLFTKSQGTIFNQNDKVVLIAPRRRDVYVIDMSSFNKDSNTYEYSRYTWVFCLKKKSDAADCIISFIRKMENLNEVRVKELRSDNGTELEITSWKNSMMKRVYLIISHLLVLLNKMVLLKEGTEH